MSSFIKPSVITRILFVMFTCLAGSQLSSAITPESFAFAQKSSFLSPEDTTNQEIVSHPGTVSGEFEKKEIDFQVNSAIEYLFIRHFRNAEARELFVQALKEEERLKGVNLRADSLRKAYASAPDDQKESIASKILALEHQSVESNNSLPEKYEHIRKLENDFWANSSEDEIRKFQQKINGCRDSLQQLEIQKNNTTESADNSRLDTIDFYPTAPKNALKAENATAIVYKVQIGAYKGRIPDSASKLIKKLSVIRKIDNAKDEKGMTVYTTGNLKTYKEAETLRNQVSQEGVRNPVITAYKNGKKITVDEARKINNEL